MNQTELEKTQLEIAKLQLEQEKHKLAQMQRRSEAVSDLGRGAAAVGGVAVKGGSAMLRYAGRYAGWAVEFTLIVAGAYLLAAYWSKHSVLTLPQRIDYLLGLPGNWGAFLVFVAPVLAATYLRPFSATAGASALRIAAVMGFLIYLAPRTSLLP